MAVDLSSGSFRGEDPAMSVLAYCTVANVERGHSQIGRASVEVKRELLTTNSNRS